MGNDNEDFDLEMGPADDISPKTALISTAYYKISSYDVLTDLIAHNQISENDVYLFQKGEPPEVWMGIVMSGENLKNGIKFFNLSKIDNKQNKSFNLPSIISERDRDALLEAGGKVEFAPNGSLKEFIRIMIADSRRQIFGMVPIPFSSQAEYTGFLPRHDIKTASLSIAHDPDIARKRIEDGAMLSYPENVQGWWTDYPWAAQSAMHDEVRSTFIALTQRIKDVVRTKQGKDIQPLSDEEVVAFHNELYQANNHPVAGNPATAVASEISGSSHESFLRNISTLTVERNANAFLTLVGLALAITSIVLFSREKKSAEDNKENLALHILELAFLISGTAMTAVFKAGYTDHQKVKNAVRGFKGLWDKYYAEIKRVVDRYDPKHRTKKLNSDSMNKQQDINFKTIPGLKWKEIARDGHCFYRACLEILKEMNSDVFKDVDDMRTRVGRYQLDNETQFKIASISESGKKELDNLKDYVNNMMAVKENERASSSQYAGELEIQALHLILKKPIVIIEENRPVYVYGDEESIEKANENQFICLLRSNGNHYDAYKPAKGMNLTATLNVLQALGLQIKYLSINQEFNSLCEAVLDAVPQLKDTYPTRKELQEKIYKECPTVDREDMNIQTSHFFALSRQLGYAIAVFQGTPETCVYYRSESDEKFSIKMVVKKESIETYYHEANVKYSEELEFSEVLGDWQKKLDQPAPVIMVQLSNGRYTKREQAGKPQELTLTELQNKLARSKENSKQSSNMGKQTENETLLNSLCETLYNKLKLANHRLVNTKDSSHTEKTFQNAQALNNSIKVRESFLKGGDEHALLTELQSTIVYSIVVVDRSSKKCTVYFKDSKNNSVNQEITSIEKLPKEAVDLGVILIQRDNNNKYQSVEQKIEGGTLTHDKLKDTLDEVFQGGETKQQEQKTGKTVSKLYTLAKFVGAEVSKNEESMFEPDFPYRSQLETNFQGKDISKQDMLEEQSKLLCELDNFPSNQAEAIYSILNTIHLEQPTSKNEDNQSQSASRQEKGKADESAPPTPTLGS